MTRVFSIGHSTHSYEQFARLLRSKGVNAIADVRSSPFSRIPHFNQGPLKSALAADGIAYVFLGEELGGRPKDETSYRDGVADYERMAESEAFQRGLERLDSGSKNFRIAMMCSERDPLDCHRCLLVGRALSGRGMDVCHILVDGQVASQAEIERELLILAGADQEDMFASDADRLNCAYRKRAQKVAYSENVQSAATG